MKYIGSKERISTGIVGVLQRLIYGKMFLKNWLLN